MNSNATQTSTNPKKAFLNVIEFTDGVLTVTDLSHPANSFTSLTLYGVRPGWYSVIVEEDGNGCPKIIRYTYTDGPAVKKTRWYKAGTVGIDSGFVGLFQNKPEYKTRELGKLMGLAQTVATYDNGKNSRGAYCWTPGKFGNYPVFTLRGLLPDGEEAVIGIEIRLSKPEKG